MEQTSSATAGGFQACQSPPFFFSESALGASAWKNAVRKSNKYGLCRGYHGVDDVDDDKIQISLIALQSLI